MSTLMKQTRRSADLPRAIPLPGGRPPSVCRQSATISSSSAESSLGGGELAPNLLPAQSVGNVDSSLNLLVLPAAAPVCLDAARPPDNSPIWHRRRCPKSNYRRRRITTGLDVDVCSFLHSMSFA